MERAVKTRERATRLHLRMRGRLVDREHRRDAGLAADGRFLLYSSDEPKSGRDLMALDLSGNDRKSIAVANTPFNEDNGQFSPNGGFVAYETIESGRSEIVVQPFLERRPSDPNVADRLFRTAHASTAARLWPGRASYAAQVRSLMNAAKEAERLSDRIGIIAQGRLIALGTLDELFARLRALIRRGAARRPRLSGKQE